MSNRRRWLWAALICVVSGLLAQTQAQAAPAAPPIDPQVIAALKSLKKPNADQRQKAFDLILEKGDAQVVPALEAYRGGLLLLVDDRLVMYGKPITLPDGSTAYPQFDALSAEPINDAGGKPVIIIGKPDLQNSMRTLPPSQRPLLSSLISMLSLLSPDPAVRVASIRDVGERAGRIYIDPEEQSRDIEALKHAASVCRDQAKPASPALAAMLLADAKELDAAAAQPPTRLNAVTPDEKTLGALQSSLRKTQAALMAAAATTQASSATQAAPTGQPAASPAEPVSADPLASKSLNDALAVLSDLASRSKAQKAAIEDLTRYQAALQTQLDKDPKGRFAPALRESLAETRLALGDRAAQLGAAQELTTYKSGRAAIILGKALRPANRMGDTELAAEIDKSLIATNGYQARVRFLKNTFDGLSASSILILLALGLSIVFGLMGVINMAHGEFMMIGAFTTYCVSSFFQSHLPASAFNYYLIAAVPAAFIVSGVLGYITEALVIRYLYGRALDSLLATWGIGLILIWAARAAFGDNLSVRPPSWVEGGVEVATDLVFPLIRIYMICYCAICIATVYFLVNRTKLGLLLRATTQNREMAAALGVATRRVDGLTFALGTGLAGLAGVVVPLYNKINPSVGQEYVVDSFMVVVTGGVGKLAGVIWAGLGLGFVGKYLEVFLNLFPTMASGASVVGKVLVLVLIIAFLQKRPSGLFPPRGRLAD